MISFIRYVQESYDSKNNNESEINNMKDDIVSLSDSYFGSDNNKHSILKKNDLNTEIDILYHCKNEFNTVESLGINCLIDNVALDILKPEMVLYDADMYAISSLGFKKEYKKYEDFRKDLEKNLSKAKDLLSKEM